MPVRDSQSNVFIATCFDWGKEQPIVSFINRALALFGTKYRLLNSSKGGGTSDEHRINLFHLLERVLLSGIPGDVVELGSHEGRSAAVMQVVLDARHSPKRLHVFDSFQGFPDPAAEDEGIYRKGQLSGVKERLVDNFRSLGLKLPSIHPGWFQDTLIRDLPSEICFVHLDADLFESTLYGLEQVYPRLVRGGICMISIYHDPLVYDRKDTPRYYKSPGVKKACGVFLSDKPEKPFILYPGRYTNAYFQKK